MLAAGLALGVAGGFALASVLTLTRAFGAPLGPWWTALAQAHGHVQIYGWAGLFVLGVALHFLPRLRGAPLARPEIIPILVAAQVTALVLRMVGQPLLGAGGAWVWRLALVGSGALECCALGGILWVALLTARRGPALRSRAALWGVLPLLAVALGSLGVAALVNLANSLQAALLARPAGVIPLGGDGLDVTLGLFGFLVPVALAMSARSLPMYAGLAPFPQRILWPACAAYGLGLLAVCVATAADARPGTWPGALLGLGTTVLGVVVLLFVVVFIRMMRQRGKLPARVAQLAPTPETAARTYRTKVAGERSAFGPFVALVASAYMWALVGALLLVVDGLTLLVGAQPPIAPDATRHAFAVGFIALLICGIAPRMVPGFSGGRITSANLVTATLWLGNTAAILRVGSLILAPLLLAAGRAGQEISLVAFGLSGPVGLALAICLAWNLWPALRLRGGRRTS
jgi:uncharacterized protein involved in response to NO